MVTAEAYPSQAITAYDYELAKTRKDIAVLASISNRNSRDLEKRVRLSYRQFHLATLTANVSDYKAARQTVSDVIRDFGPKEDICLLKANLDGRFHCLAEMKQDLQMCPSLEHRVEGRAIQTEIDFHEGRYEQARDALECLVSENCTWDILARLAYMKGKTGHYDEADRLYEEAEADLTAKEMRSFAWLELQRGVLAMSRGKYDQARSRFQRAGNAYTGHWYTDAHMASLLAAEGNINEALMLLSKVIARAPKPEYKQALGELFQLQGKADEAKPWFDAALTAYLASVQEGAVHYFHHLVSYYTDVGGQPAEAVRWAQKDVALRSNFSTQSALAWALFQNGEVADGLVWIRLALSSGVQDSTIFTIASHLFHANGDTVESARYARAASKISPDAHHVHIHV